MGLSQNAAWKEREIDLVLAPTNALAVSPSWPPTCFYLPFLQIAVVTSSIFFLAVLQIPSEAHKICFTFLIQAMKRRGSNASQPGVNHLALPYLLFTNGFTPISPLPFCPCFYSRTLGCAFGGASAAYRTWVGRPLQAKQPVPLLRQPKLTRRSYRVDKVNNVKTNEHNCARLHVALLTYGYSMVGVTLQSDLANLLCSGCSATRVLAG